MHRGQNLFRSQVLPVSIYELHLLTRLVPWPWPTFWIGFTRMASNMRWRRVIPPCLRRCSPLYGKRSRPCNSFSMRSAPGFQIPFRKRRRHASIVWRRRLIPHGFSFLTGSHPFSHCGNCGHVERAGWRRQFRLVSHAAFLTRAAGTCECDQYRGSLARLGCQHVGVFETAECTPASFDSTPGDERRRWVGGSGVAAENATTYFSASCPLAPAGWDAAVCIRQCVPNSGRQDFRRG